MAPVRHRRAGRLRLRPARGRAARRVPAPPRRSAPPPARPAPAQRRPPGRDDGRGARALGPRRRAGARAVRRAPSATTTSATTPASCSRRPPCWPTWACSSPTASTTSTRYYVIRNSDHLSGFTDHEIELIALVARYHRKSAPVGQARRVRRAPPDRPGHGAGAGRHPPGGHRPRPDPRRTGHRRCAPAARARPSSSRPSRRPGADLGLELYTANERKALLEEVIGRPVRIEAVGSGPGAEAGRGGAAVASDPLDQPA